MNGLPDLPEASDRAGSAPVRSDSAEPTELSAAGSVVDGGGELIELSPAAPPRRWAVHTRAAALVAMMGVPGVLHFVQPEFFDKLVPGWLPVDPRLVTHVSGGVELASALLVAVPKTRRIGGFLSFATLVSVFPANAQAAIDGGMAHLDPPFNSPAAAWIRLPFQLPMMWLALKVASDAKKPVEPAITAASEDNASA